MQAYIYIEQPNARGSDSIAPAPGSSESLRAYEPGLRFSSRSIDPARRRARTEMNCGPSTCVLTHGATCSPESRARRRDVPVRRCICRSKTHSSHSATAYGFGSRPRIRGATSKFHFKARLPRPVRIERWFTTQSASVILLVWAPGATTASHKSTRFAPANYFGELTPARRGSSESETESAPAIDLQQTRSRYESRLRWDWQCFTIPW